MARPRKGKFVLYSTYWTSHKVFTPRVNPVLIHHRKQVCKQRTSRTCQARGAWQNLCFDYKLGVTSKYLFSPKLKKEKKKHFMLFLEPGKSWLLCYLVLVGGKLCVYIFWKAILRFHSKNHKCWVYGRCCCLQQVTTFTGFCPLFEVKHLDSS